MFTKRTVIIAILFIFLSAFVGCEQEGPAERAGEKIDEAVEESADKVEEAGDAIEEKAEEIEDKAE